MISDSHSHTGAYSPRLDRALKLAAIVHRRQQRRGTRIPYIMHPVQVARILEHYGYGEDAVIAGLLHDVIEDARPDDEEMHHGVAETFPPFDPTGGVEAPAEQTSQRLRTLIEREFGRRVLMLVDAVTEQKREHGVDRPWKVRKEEALAALAARGRTEPDIAALKAADALHNVQSIAQDLATGGVRIMSRFNAEPHETVWYFRAVARIVREATGDAPLVHELQSAVENLATTLLQVYEAGRRNLREQLSLPVQE
ncbi:MAG: HD domain-containing protein [Luteitalea sp.]|nr:HD domain-containing protein [Luteitalea sp.]